MKNNFFTYPPLLLRSEDLIIPESMAQDFGFTAMLGKQAHSRLRNCFPSMAVESKDQSDSGIIKSSLLSILIYVLSSSLTLASGSDNKKIIMAYLEQGLSELKNNEKQVALQLLANEIALNSGYHIRIKAIKTFTEIQHLIKNKNIDIAIFNSFHYINHYDFFQQYATKPIWAIQRGPTDKENFIVIANKQNADQQINFFKNKRLSLHTHYLLMGSYLDTLVKQTSGLNRSQFFKHVKNTKTASQAILDVYFGISDLCIVPEHVFKLALDLNPAILKKLSIIHQSGSLFIPVLSFTFKHVSPAVADTLNSNLYSLNDSTRGKQILNIFNIQAIKTIEQEQLIPMQKLFLNRPALPKK